MSPQVSEHSPVLRLARLADWFGGFLARFLGHTPSFRRFRRLNQWGIAGHARGLRIRVRCWANPMTSEYGYKEFDASPVRSLKGPLGPTTSNSINRGLAAMPAQERSIEIGGRAVGGDQSRNQRQYREAMASNTSPKGPAQQSRQGSHHASGPRADAHRAVGRGRLGSGPGRSGGSSRATAVVRSKLGHSSHSPTGSPRSVAGLPANAGSGGLRS